MNYSKGIEPVTVLNTRSAELIKQAKDTGQPIIITQNGKPTAVLQDVESFQRQREALLLLKILTAGDKELREGQAIGHDDVMERIARKIQALQRD